MIDHRHPERIRLAFQLLKEDRNKLYLRMVAFWERYTELVSVFYPENEECNSCAFLHSAESEYDHSKCEKKTDFTCDNCVKIIERNRIKDVCYSCVSQETLKPIDDKKFEKRLLYYKSYNLGEFLD